MLGKTVEDAKQKQHQGGQPSILVFAQNITPEWTDVSKLPNLQLVLTALQDQQKQQEQQQQHLQTNADNAVVDEGNEKDQPQKQYSKQVQDELEAFLRSTEDDDGQNYGDDNENDGGGGENSAESNVPTNNGSNDKHVFEADDGMRYVRDPMTGNWIHEGLAPTTHQSESTAKAAGDGDTTKNKNQNINNTNQQQKKKKKKKNDQ
mmetsp:Transcript_47742/g.116225  ORF Transcript_47742/g.116225 Transcript_47742/m.116225 type:complete len:205 (+) Transcript_47742:190-804(+)